MRTLIFAAIVLALTGCGSEPATTTNAEDSDGVSPIPTPSHVYAEERDGIYYYVSGISENDRKAGKATGDVIAVRYLGQNKEGDYRVTVLDDDGSALSTASCARDCRIIRFTTGQKLEYNPDSIIGNVFHDAMAGELQVKK